MTIRFSTIGLTHDHVFALTDLLLGAGGELVSAYADEQAQFDRYKARYPQVTQANSADRVLEDDTIQLIVGIPVPNERADLGIRTMQHGKDFLADKPGFITLEHIEQARRVQAETGQKFLVYFSERMANAATVKASELLHSGAIGKLIHMVGLAPHRLNPSGRAPWFFKRSIVGGILIDLGIHQIDQFLHFTQSTSADITLSQLANYNHPEYPELDDFGDLMLQNDVASAYARVDWFTPEGLGTWGDVRTFLTGTDGYIEIRKIIDVQGRPGGNHLLLVNQEGQQYIDCNSVPLPFGEQLVYDILNRTETAVSQEHCFVVSELAIRAELNAQRLR